MSCNGILVLSITWILTSLVWFFAIENTAVGIIWLCGGVVELIIALIRRNRKASKCQSTKQSICISSMVKHTKAA